MRYNHPIQLVDGVEIRNLKISTTVDQVITGVFRAVLAENSSDIADIQVCSNGVDWFSLRGYKAENTTTEGEGRVSVYHGLSADGKKLQFRVLKAGKSAEEEYSALSISSNASGIISIDLSEGFKGKIDTIVSDIEDKVDKIEGKGLSTNDFTDAFYAKLNTIQIKKNEDGSGKYQLVYNDGTADIQLGVDIPLDSVIESGFVKECTVADEPVIGYKVGDKYLDFKIANSSEHIYILVTDLIDVMDGFEGDEITTTVDGSTIKASLNDNSINITKLKEFVLGEYSMSNTLIVDDNEYTIRQALRIFASNIKDIYDKKANTTQTIIAPEGSSTQYDVGGNYTINELIQRALNNIKYLFDNKANSDHSHEGYLKPTDVIDNITDSSTTKPLSAKQGKILGGLINERLKGVKVDGVELTPDANKIVDIPVMAGAGALTDGEVGLVPKPLSGQQGAFLRGDGTFGLPNADVVASASYVGGSNPVLEGMTSCQSVVGGNVEILLENSYVAREAFAGAVDIVRVMRNGLDLTEGEDFLIEEDIVDTRKKITLIDYPLHTDDDIILVRYKTSIGVYGSVFQETIDNAIEVTNDAIDAAQRAEEAAIDAENIADSKIDKTSIKQTLGDSETDIMSQKAITEAIMKAHDYDINFFAYGVSRDLTGAGTTLTRVGNLSLHKTRPILRKVRGCVKNAQGINYYLHNDTDLLKEDGITPSVLDGTDGDVMTEIPEMYVYEYTEGNYEYTYLSEFPLPNFKRIPKTYHGRYEGSYDTTTNQLRSVINPNIRTGLPATGQSVFYYNSGAIKDRNLDWSPDRLLSHYVRALLFRVHYATYDSQAPYNSALTPEGYLQGGLGIGVTDINSTKWSKYNGYNPFIPCGYTAELGNKTGVKDFYMPFEYDGYNTTAEDNTQYYKGVYNASTAYNVNELVADMEDSVIGKGDGKLYKCILNAPAGTELTNTTYFALQTRTKTEANRFLVEIPFGHIWKHTIDAIIEITGDGTSTKCYVYDNPAHFTSTKTVNARFLCDMPSASGYIKLFNNYTIVPYSIGGSSGAWGYDYFYWVTGVDETLRGFLFGGAAYRGSSAGLGCSDSNYSPTYASTDFGVRLC
ncbi:MAG: hypothetical protein PHO12_07630, partial [Bacteroidales bacterium]|nr:hypothetical protein [Bacteroidales bacterium]